VTYLNVDEVESALIALARAFPADCELITLPTRTIDGRTSHALRLGPRASGALPTLMLIGGVHAREWGSCEILINLAADLLAAHARHAGLRYGNQGYSAAEVGIMLQRLNILIFPQVNPDGRHHSQTADAMWRKNRNPAYSGGQSACVGVDINRNYDFLFDFATAFSPQSDVSVSADPCDYQVFHGPAPFSEPETQNVRWLFDTNDRVRWFVDVHSYSEDVLYSWGDDDNQSNDPGMNFRNPAFNGKRGLAGDAAYREFIPPGDLDTATYLAGVFKDGLRAVRGKTYTAKTSFNLYPTSGTSDDYAYARHFVDPGKGKIFASVVEWGTEFQPPWAEMQLIIADVTAALLATALEAALDAPYQLATQTRNPNQMDVFAIDADGRAQSAWWHGEWHDWFQVGTRTFPPNTPVSTQTRNPNQMDVFAVGEDGGAYSAWWNGDWHDWFRIGALAFPRGTPISTQTRNPNQMDLFAVDAGGRVQSAWWHGEWHDWFQIGTRLFPRRSQVATQTRNPNQMDLFAIGEDGAVYSAWWNGDWHDWFRVGTRATFAPGAPIATQTRNPNQMDVFATDANGEVYSAWWHGEWHDWFRVGTMTFPPNAPIATQTRNPNQMDVFAVGRDGGMYSAWWNGEWHDWFRIGTMAFAPNTPVVTQTRNPNQMDVFAVGRDGAVYSAWWNGEWHDWFRVGTHLIG
jgi:murein tripeptide amidase MpaA/ubiquitin